MGDNFESLLIWGAVYLYAVITILLLTAFIFNKERLLNFVIYLLVPAFILHSTVFFMRWSMTGYFPANGEYENAVAEGWFGILFTVILFLWKKGLRGVGLVTVPATLFFLGYGIMKNPEVLPHGAALKSSWLVIHVMFAQLAYGAYLIASGLGLIYILKDNKVRKKIESTFYNKFPALPVIDETMFRFTVFGFIADAIMIAAGSIWAKDLWGSYWSWDPVEVWSLVSWLIYGLTIHLKVTMGWGGRRLAWILIFAVLGIVITYWGVDIIVRNTQHAFTVSAL
ncbi:MAG: cytochrome c biogenesis protein CcsA [Nitrospirae bacterium]|nr:cytochrome c biogenesis protein CcsA [Nitrospirota bacterium]